MKKIIYSLLFVVFVGEVVGKNADFVELSDSMRELTGRIEELEKIVGEMQKKISSLNDFINKSANEAAIQKEMEAITGKTPEEIIKSALDLIEENSIEEARKILNAFVAKNPTNIYCGMMFFYIGNAYFVEKDYKNAAIEYMKGFKANPTGSKAAETLYKLAICFKQLNEKDKCKSTLNKIISDYSGEFVKKASAELKKIK
ncbi:MAG: tetratricopeptide repeat protein [Holosporaceae bacterium]|nr:tetratricopeptide repeat protein [Holosporaceae bacterium]